MIDTEYMKIAIDLARKATGYTSPNPLVGAVIVKGGQIIGRGYHHKAGTPHAEIHALNEAGKESKDATLYVTLEPCSHYGRTPPCAKRVIEAGIRRVVIGTLDPNPLVSGKGVELLEQAGIEVHVGVMAKACADLNEAFFYYIQKGKPFITVKSAMTLDGKIATRYGESKWITNDEARIDSHELRANHDAILVGIGTILADNPQLTCRSKTIKTPHQPDVIILDSRGRTPSNANIFTETSRNILIFVGPNSKLSDRQRLIDIGADVVMVQEDTHGLCWTEILEELGKRQYVSVLIEGGARIISSYMQEQYINKFVIYIGDKIMGDEFALNAFSGSHLVHLSDSLSLAYEKVMLLGNNIKIIAYEKERRGRLCLQELLKK
ncbi:hypothetical protein HMPREF0872_00125 [Veillonella montpellierensis DNF00314]|uniref:Riboflavin biosynthesis protein RibD n=1 Tax=Veillonella montpellierensis DNF00314 TaxID=1401067 RepID=A0A096ANV8_9FIRM|nr:bifunctional diaminohydroxyphosphoribosylaminopyrimidine deaminase/5-amino-6-(5-phosphoribosylamino)uracil reductase RibD [Veillonella montpellierensis]KGF48376.1 hypothetical protein HMPREF0872_00125 [Veillonella montpellierensis DNF00314]